MADADETNMTDETNMADEPSKKENIPLLASIVTQKKEQVEINMHEKLHTQQSSGPLRIAVFIKKDRRFGGGGSYELELIHGRATTAAEIKDLMLQNLAIENSAHMFALWFISPYLELQLKPIHKPFYLRKQWQELLKKLSHCPPDELNIDEPVLVFQRNSFVTIADEKKVTEKNALKRLFEEASYNILKARYPISVDVAVELGGILLRCYEGKYNAEEHRSGAFKKKLDHYLPYYAIGSNKISQYIYSGGAEQRLLEQFQEASKKLNDQGECYKAFLERCYQLSFYGCAFFKGYCYQEGTDYKIWKSERIPIMVGINRSTITVFKGETEEVLASISCSEELTWDFKDGEIVADKSEDDDKPAVNQFIIQYQDGDESRQIDIISNQARLMDAMVQSCVNFSDGVDDVDGTSILDASSLKKLRCISYATPVNDPKV